MPSEATNTLTDEPTKPEPTAAPDTEALSAVALEPLVNEISQAAAMLALATESDKPHTCWMNEAMERQAMRLHDLAEALRFMVLGVPPRWKLCNVPGLEGGPD